TYKSGDYTFTIKYKGKTGSVSETQKNFIIASKESNLTATKLGYPTLTSVDIQVDESTIENRIRWEAVPNAKGYRALVITQIKNADGTTEDKIFEYSYILSDSSSAGNYFVDNGSIYDLKLNNVLKANNIEIANGITVNVYVQAIGTLDSAEALENGEKLYINGSFSNKAVVKIPSKATDLTFDTTKGTLNWKVDNASDGHNVQLTTTYTVTGASVDDLNNYWIVTSNKVNSEDNSDVVDENKRPSSISSRTITYTYSTTDGLYTINVIDVIFLEASKNGGSTPTSYQLTNIGTNYQFTVVILVADGKNYRSEESTLSGTGSAPIKFDLFKFGDGSASLPYGIETAQQLNNIRYFLDRHFVIISDIELDTKASWDMIDGTFTGVIDGKDHLISNVKPTSIHSLLSNNTNYIMKAFMKENKGTIKNLNISIDTILSGNTYNSKVEVAGLVITNTGTIDKVNITTISGGAISVSYTGTISNTRVAGIAVENSGTISNSSVVVSKIEGLHTDTKNGILTTNVAGIASVNTGTISNTYFDGEIKGNYVSGIANENSGTISNCYALGTAYVTDVDAAANSTGG
ncbi:MAG: hypothetical protein ACI4PF_05475, partial [Christensenellales bacterium]